MNAAEFNGTNLDVTEAELVAEIVERCGGTCMSAINVLAAGIAGAAPKKKDQSHIVRVLLAQHYAVTLMQGACDGFIEYVGANLMGGSEQGRAVHARYTLALREAGRRMVLGELRDREAEYFAEKGGQ